LDPVGLLEEVAWVVVGAEVVGFGGAEPVTGELLETADMVVRIQTSYKNRGILFGGRMRFFTCCILYPDSILL